jgi:K+-transporting ATPase ATPase C chain
MLWQVPRVAKARGIAAERAKAVVDSNMEGRTIAILGEPRVNVLLVNLALDRQFGRPASMAVREKKGASEDGSTTAKPDA